HHAGGVRPLRGFRARALEAGDRAREARRRLRPRRPDGVAARAGMISAMHFFEGAAMADGIEVIAQGLQFPEGPVALRDGSVLVVEIRGRTIRRVAPDRAVTLVADCGGGPNGAAIGPDGALYVCNN